MASALNKVLIIGNLTRDPELRQTPNGQAVTTFGVATNRSWTDASGKKQEETEFHNVVAWGRLAEICSQYLAKGRKVFIEGRLRTRDWEGQDSVRRYRTEIITENMVMLDRPPAGAQSVSVETRHAASLPPNETALPPAKDEEAIKLEDIPF